MPAWLGTMPASQCVQAPLPADGATRSGGQRVQTPPGRPLLVPGRQSSHATAHVLLPLTVPLVAVLLPLAVLLAVLLVLVLVRFA